MQCVICVTSGNAESFPRRPFRQLPLLPAGLTCFPESAMKRFGPILSIAAALILVATTQARADGFRSYRVCGGDQFTTCAAVEINVVGTSVTVRMWNLSGNYGATGVHTAGGTVFNTIGFYNVPTGVAVVTGTLATAGNPRPGDAPGSWHLRNDSKVSFVVDYSAGNGNGLDDGIASGCADPASLPTGVDLYQNPCSDPSTNPSGWVTMTFQVTGGTWDPGTSDIVFRGKNAQGGNVECWTSPSPEGLPANCTRAVATPEPVTMTLLATGLASMAGAGYVRRKGKWQEPC